MNLTNRTALVTGGARGIGLELTRQLASRAVHVVAVGRNVEHLHKLEAELGARVSVWPADLARREDVERLIAELPTQHPNLSLVINNAGVQVEADFVSGDAAALRAALRDEIGINFEAVVLLCAGLLPLLRQQPTAAIVNITSGLALAPKPSAPVYCATKAAVRSFTRAMRYQCETAAPNVRLIDAVMSLVDTDMTAGRGRGKISTAKAAAEVLAGIEADRAEIYVDRAKLLKLVMRVAPSIGERIMRRS